MPSLAVPVTVDSLPQAASQFSPCAVVLLFTKQEAISISSQRSSHFTLVSAQRQFSWPMTRSRDKYRPPPLRFLANARMIIGTTSVIAKPSGVLNETDDRLRPSGR